MPGEAVLTVLADGKTYDLNVIWRQGYDSDAVVSLPESLRTRWLAAVKHLQTTHPPQTPIAPYPTLPFELDISRISSSATGFYATAEFAFGNARWKISPPYPRLAPLKPGIIS